MPASSWPTTAAPPRERGRGDPLHEAWATRRPREGGRWMEARRHAPSCERRVQGRAARLRERGWQRRRGQESGCCDADGWMDSERGDARSEWRGAPVLTRIGEQRGGAELESVSVGVSGQPVTLVKRGRSGGASGDSGSGPATHGSAPHRAWAGAGRRGRLQTATWFNPISVISKHDVIVCNHI